MSGTTITGNFKDCGQGQKPQLDFVCQGAACPSFEKFPQGAVADTGNNFDSLSYKSDANCESVKSNYFGSLLFQQQSQPGIDASVSQEQNITLPKCKGLHVQSDGTTDGTQVDLIGRTNEPDCAPILPSSTPIIIPQSSSIPVGTSTPIVTPSATESQPAQYTGKASQSRPHMGVLLVCFLMISFLVQGSTAYLLPDGNRHVEVRKHVMGPDTLKRTTYNMRLRALSDNILTFANEFGDYVAGQVDAVNGNGEAFAAKLISDTLSTVCGGYFSGAAVGAFSPGVVDGCVTAVYTANTEAAPEVELLSVFGASMFCNYVVAQVFPVAEEFSSEACQGLEVLILKPPVSTYVPPPPSSYVPPPPSSHVPPPPSTYIPPHTSEPPPKSSKVHPPPSSKIPPPETTKEPITWGPPPVTHEPSKPITHWPSKPTHEPSKPTHEPSKPTHEPSKPTHGPSIPTAEPTKPCNGADLMTDKLNCGSCGHQCSELQECNHGCCAHRGRYGEDCQGISPNTTIIEPPETTLTSWVKSSGKGWGSKTSEKESWTTIPKTSEKEGWTTIPKTISKTWTWEASVSTAVPAPKPTETETEPSHAVETEEASTTRGRKLSYSSNPLLV